jgi:hypothetical protein
MAKAAIVTARTEAVARREVVVIRITFFGVREDVERVHDLLMGVRARLRAVCVVANPRNSQAIAVVCASQPIPNRIPHTFIRDHEHVLRACFGGRGGARVPRKNAPRRKNFPHKKELVPHEKSIFQQLNRLKPF